MKASNLKKAIERFGGQAEIITTHVRGERGNEWDRVDLKGTLHGFDIEMHGEESDFFTARRIKDRGYFDPGSDYNSGGYSFYHRLKELQWLVDRALRT